MQAKSGDRMSDGEFLGLVLRYEEKMLTEAELTQLNDALRDDPGYLDDFIRAFKLSHLIREVHGAPTPSQLAPRRSSTLRWANYAAITAVLCTIVAIFWGWRDGLPGAEPDQSAATLSGIDQVTWDRDHDMPRNVGQKLGKGWIRIESGKLEITFHTGAIVKVQGPAVFGIVSPMKGFLEYGGVEVYAPEKASDFVISTPAMDVVDLGTRFKLDIEQSSGSGQIEVLEGRVDLHLNKAGRKTQIRPLIEGQSADVDSQGNVVGTEGGPRDGVSARASASLLAHWKLDESGESSTIRDATANRLHGKLIAGRESLCAREVSIPGSTGRALSLNGARFVDLSSHVEVLGRLKSYTITAWVRDPENMIFAISCGARRGYRIQFERYQDLLVYGWQNGGPWDAIDAVVDGWQPSRWYHVAVTVSGGNVVLYRDGEPLIGPRHTGTRMSTPVQRPFDLKWKTDACIGKVARLGQNQYLNGQVDDLQVYRQALDAEAIRYLFEHPGAVVDNDYYSEVKGRP